MEAVLRMAVWQLCDYRSDVMCQYSSLKTEGKDKYDHAHAILVSQIKQMDCWKTNRSSRWQMVRLRCRQVGILWLHQAPWPAPQSTNVGQGLYAELSTIDRYQKFIWSCKRTKRKSERYIVPCRSKPRATPLCVKDFSFITSNANLSFRTYIFKYICVRVRPRYDFGFFESRYGSVGTTEIENPV